MITKEKFLELCEKYGSPDDVPCDDLPVSVAATLSMSDRFWDDGMESAHEFFRQHRELFS